MSTPNTTTTFEGEDDTIVAPADDRRKNERQIATFRTCCVEIDGEAHPAILRNMSAGGAMFEALVDATPGDRITYWWDGIKPVEARVAWVDGHRIGVANLSGPAAKVEVPRPRATRVPANLPVRIWAAGNSRCAQLDNISLSGIAVHGIDGVRPGTLCTIEIGGHTLHNASVVRTEDGLTGIRFERPLPPARLMQLIERGGQPAQTAETPRADRAKTQMSEPPPGERQRREPEGEGEPPPAPAPLRRFL